MSVEPPTAGDGRRTRINRRRELHELLAYTTADQHAPLYKAIMDVFLRAAAGYRSRLRSEEVHAGLRDGGWTYPLTVADVQPRLVQLAAWGNLDEDHDDEGATLEQYERKAPVYDLTPAGEVVHEAIVSLDDDLRRVGGLQTVLLRQILTALDTLAGQMVSAVPDGEVIYTRVEELHGTFKAMTGNAALFMQQVNRMLSARRLDAEEFYRFKQDTIAYLTGFLADLDELAPGIRQRTTHLAAIEPARRSAALAAAARASGQRALDGRDAAGEWRARAERQIAGVIAWFAADPGADAGVEVLSAKARQAVLGIARSAERIREAGSMPSARTGDLMALARMFADADDSEIHAIWKAAFGLTPARHLTDIHPDSDLYPADTPFHEAPRIEVSLRLRANEVGKSIGRAPNLPDHSASRQLLAVRARTEIEAAAAAADTLIQLGRQRLSHTSTVLDRPTLLLLARLIFRAQRTAANRDGWQQAVSIDGRLRIRIRHPRSPAAATVHAEHGRWILPDYEVEVLRTQAGASR